jgi:hypothetical protein
VRDDGGVRVLDCRWSRSPPAIEDGGVRLAVSGAQQCDGASPQGQVISEPWVGLEEEEERVTNSEATCHEEDERY